MPAPPFALLVSPANPRKKSVDPRGLEPLTSAMRVRNEGLQGFSGACKKSANSTILMRILFSTFQDIYSGCCTDGKACTRTRSRMIAIGLEGRHSTKEPRWIACLRVLLPRVGLNEVN